MNSYQIHAPHFCAGVGFERRTCRQAAPILRWMLGWSITQVRHYCEKKHWRMEALAALLVLMAGCSRPPEPPPPAHAVSPYSRMEACAYRNVQSRKYSDAIATCRLEPTSIERSECGDRADAAYSLVANKVAAADKICEGR